MASQWYYGKDGQRLGPVSSSQLKELAASGTIRPTDLVWKQGMSSWAEAHNVQGLFSSLAGTTASGASADADLRKSPPPSPKSSISPNAIQQQSAPKPVGSLPQAFLRAAASASAQTDSVLSPLATAATSVSAESSGRIRAEEKLGRKGAAVVAFFFLIVGVVALSEPGYHGKTENLPSSVSFQDSSGRGESGESGEQAKSSGPYGSAGHEQSPSFPINWDLLLQMTGRDGPGVRVFTDDQGNIGRVETTHQLSVLVAVERYENGFSVALANLWAVADFTTRPWFTKAESDRLTEIYSEYVASPKRSVSDPADVGRYKVRMAQDRKYGNMPCFILLPRQD